ncbi:tryptophanyl-tRNA synthetase [Actinoplanes sp. SE50]|uniref:tryptophan--tRNA ligase n=1 Tax=unclassified Actinoplanes TaxID=2626549 RepID=UPI00023ED581|nr:MULTISPECIES: tryptophan--tRNA ligase [unclassified Actinoplanes]AEV82277.1 tryptophanyl-tRNA synthetase [Actinoplanes sp. SE50/110]ATO80674.1 tryptophanyl-tRNA synthetase [Actinoplanes sp. SE50]SLL98081.1 tryptophan--tRNA ligase [Actinoplanes sp. SE50/110]
MTTTVTAAPASTRRLSGFQPTGHLHLGNLLGALRPLIAAQGAAESIALIADLHAMTVDHDPGEVRRFTLEQVSVLLAAGVDPERTPIVLQSQVREHTELHYLLECAAAYGEAARMIQFREKSAAGGPVRLSLLTYPVLMAADILLYDVTQVPVGEDQNQHLELARTLATRFNSRYGATFTVPEGVRPDATARVMDLAEPTTKMGKTTGTGRIGLLDSPDVIRRTIARAATDTLGVVRRDREAQPGVTNLIDILAGITGARPSDATSYAALKREVTEAVIALLAPLQARHRELQAHPDFVRGVLTAGAERVRPIAAATVSRARQAIGLLD